MFLCQNMKNSDYSVSWQLGSIFTFFSVALIFGGITVAAGFIGVALGAESSRRYKKRNPRADPIICSIGLLVCTPFLFFALVMSRYQTTLTWVSNTVEVHCKNCSVSPKLFAFLIFHTLCPSNKGPPLGLSKFLL